MVMKDAQAPAVFFANGIGDALLALPALRALCSVFPERLTLITRPASYVDLLARLPLRQSVIVKSGARSGWEERESREVAASLGPCDLLISLVPWHSPSLAYLSRTLCQGRTIGYHESFDVHLPRDYTKHSAALMFDAVRAIDDRLQLRDFLSPPSYSARARETVLAVKQTLQAGSKLMAMHTETIPEKAWPAASWCGVLHEFLRARPEFVTVLVNYVRDVPPLPDAHTEQRVVDASGLPLEDALCLVQHADLFVGVDSCMLHAADYGNVPSVGLFISTKAHEFGFLTAPHVALEASSADQIPGWQVGAALQSVAAHPELRTTLAL